MGVSLSPLRLGESPKNIGAEFGLKVEVLEEAEVSEKPLEGVSGKGLEWKEHAVVGTTGRGSE